MDERGVIQLRPRPRGKAQTAYLTVDEAAERAKVSKRTIERWVAREGCPHIRPPGSRLVRIPLERFDAWLESGR